MFLSTSSLKTPFWMSILQIGKRYFGCHDLPSLQCLTSSAELRGECSECSRVQLEASSWVSKLSGKVNSKKCLEFQATHDGIRKEFQYLRVATRRLS